MIPNVRSKTSPRTFVPTHEHKVANIPQAVVLRKAMASKTLTIRKAYALR